MSLNKRIILEDGVTLHTLIELLLHIEGKGEFIIKKNRGSEAVLMEKK